MRTYTTDGAIPSFTSTDMFADLLVDPSTSTSSLFGVKTVYDASSRLLYVTDPGLGTLSVYFNEDLYWLPVQTITPDTVYIASGGLTAYFYNLGSSPSSMPNFGVLSPSVIQSEWAVNQPTGPGSFAAGHQSRQLRRPVDGQINVTTSESVTFYLGSDDGSKLYIDSSLVGEQRWAAWLHHPERHCHSGRRACIIVVQYFEAGGSAGISLEYQAAGVRTLLSGAAGRDLDVDGNWVVLGAPDAKAYVYSRSQTSFTLWQTLTGTGGFGSSVAISGSHIVVGAPGALVDYYSAGQADSGYRLQLGSAGAVYAYTLSGSTWGQPQILMPYDSALPTDTSSSYQHTPLGEGWGGVPHL